MRHPSETTRDVVPQRFWLAMSAAAMIVVWFGGPYFVERFEYAAARGRQRAEYEAAGDVLQGNPLEQISQAYQRVSQRVAPSVVSIRVMSVVETPTADDLSSLFGGGLRAAQGEGSGVIVDSAGYVLTNNHVVANATRIEVGLADGRTVAAQVVGADSLTDLALLQIEASPLTAAEWGDSDSVEVGALVWAVGSPYGLQHSITAGILSGKNRQGLSGTIYHDFLQTDAAVNPGNSGGPLVDSRGRVIGINTAIYGESYQGICFAIPAKEAREVYERLRSQGHVERGWLGVALEELDDASRTRLELPAGQGVLVSQVIPDSPAERAGLRPGDLILLWDGVSVGNKTSLSRLVARATIGSTVEATVLRRGEKLQLAIVIRVRPG